MPSRDQGLFIPTLNVVPKTVPTLIDNQKYLLGLADVAQWLNDDPGTKRSPVSFPVRAHAQVVGLIPSGGRAGGGQSMFSLIDVSVFPSFFLSLKLIKEKKIFVGPWPVLFSSQSIGRAGD
uniref:Uncharacterized protein n=1 Tax=Molossus molossus TaxID=27622 RepID=A0A7J8EEU0_MOLMO|nr:hypothetical protein HJG59_008939 [Molossus molossus]